MNKIKIAIVGYGNVGKMAFDAVNETSDMEVSCIIRKNISDINAELKNIPVVKDISAIDFKIDVAILCLPSRIIKEEAKKYLALGINTVDSFDIHSEIVDLRNELKKTALENNVSAIVSAGWDPGSDSVIRALLETCAPKGVTYTNFGPGMSMGHSVVVKAIDGVKNALSITIPLGTGIHRRIVYVELEKGVDFEKISNTIKKDSYFINDETHVIKTNDINSLIDVGHGVNIQRKGVSGTTHNQLFEFNMKINNPALTSQVLVSCARAVTKQNSGAYTMIEIPPIDFLYGEKDELIKRLV